MTPKEILREKWGFEQFRFPQEEIINSVLDQKNTVAIMPTGAGKSLCFQIPALAMEGICIVICPLIALMKDQVEGLNKKGINAKAIYTGLHPKEIDGILDNCIYGNIKFLYCSPERLSTGIFIERAKKMSICLIAIDEAHCISQWGEDFRPAYLAIEQFVGQLSKRPNMIALTASATQKVRIDIIEKLNLNNVSLFETSIKRENLVYAVRKTEDKDKKLIEIFEKIAGSGIVYVNSRKKTKEIADLLNQNKISTGHYNAGLTQEERNIAQKKWMNNEFRVMVATNAFGMGIDKPDVRLVVHLNLNENLEDYYQEAGRAGRDGQKAIATIVFNEDDLYQIKEKHQKEFPKLEDLQLVYQSLANYFQLAIGVGEFETFDFEIVTFCQRYNLKIQTAFMALKTLEGIGLITLSEAMKNPASLRIEMDNKDLYKFQIENERYDKLIKTILRICGGEVFSQFVKINETSLANLFMAPVQEIKEMLKQMQLRGAITYVPSSEMPKITYLSARKDVKELMKFKKILEDKKERKEQKIEKIIEYVTQNKKCRQQMIGHYFDEIAMEECGICDVCLEKKKARKIETDDTDLEKMILKEIKMNQKTLPKKLLDTFKDIEESRIKQAVKNLVEIEQIKLMPDGTIQII